MLDAGPGSPESVHYTSVCPTQLYKSLYVLTHSLSPILITDISCCRFIYSYCKVVPLKGERPFRGYGWKVSLRRWKQKLRVEIASDLSGNLTRNEHDSRVLHFITPYITSHENYFKIHDYLFTVSSTANSYVDLRVISLHLTMFNFMLWRYFIFI